MLFGESSRTEDGGEVGAVDGSELEERELVELGTLGDLEVLLVVLLLLLMVVVVVVGRDAAEPSRLRKMLEVALGAGW